MPKHRKPRSAAFESIKQGLEEAIAHRRGEPVPGVRVHEFERLPDGTVRRPMLQDPVQDEHQ
jgi:hypothetical protein